MAQAQAVRDPGGEIWVADATALRECPPVRAGWSNRGAPATVLISGRTTRRPLLGARNATTGERVRLVRERCRTPDVLALVEALGQVRPDVPTLVMWDTAPAHMPLPVRQPAAEAGITIAFLPFRAPELMPLEELWRGLKQTVAANRCYASLDDVAERAMAWLDDMSESERLPRCRLHSSKFIWLPT